jgi:glycosyltransferase involved in cell wall biosynthesis
MRISVIVPFRNAEPYLRRCITSLLDQSFSREHYEIIMVNNNSTDRSVVVAASYSRVKLLSERRPSSYAARNLAVRASKGEIVAFTDANCSADSDWLERIAARMQSPNQTVIQGRRDFANDSFALSALALYEAEKARFIFSQDDRPAYYASMANLATRKSALEEAGPLPEIPRGGDVAFVQQMIRRYGCRAVSFAPEVRVRDLEVRHVGVWYRKLFAYGHSHANYRKLVAVRRLGVLERTRIYRSGMRNSGFSLSQAALSLPILALGAACYDVGLHLPFRRCTAGKSSLSGLS